MPVAIWNPALLNSNGLRKSFNVFKLLELAMTDKIQAHYGVVLND